MLRMVTKDSYNDLNEILTGIRSTFADVFAEHYTTILLTATAGRDERTLDGFSDLIKRRFNGDITLFSRTQIYAVLHALYSGPGISDELAFIRSFHGFEASHQSARTWNQSHQKSISAEDQMEINEYLSIIEKENRDLREVNFVALVDPKNKVMSFCIYHLFKDGEREILHIRQAATRNQHQGCAATIARFLADHYPHALYEANQRWANRVMMKEQLEKEGLFEKTGSVLGYSDRYLGWRSKFNLPTTLYLHYLGLNHPSAISARLSINMISKLGLKKFGHFWEAESLPRLAFSDVQFFKEMGNDDNYIGCEHNYIAKSRKHRVNS